MNNQPITPHSSGSCGLQEDIPSAPQNLKIGDWCLAKYEGVKYPGVVKGIVASGPEYEVSVMHPSGGYFKWPTKVDCIHYPADNIIGKICAPIPIGSRGQFMFMF